MIFQQFRNIGCLSYLIGDEDTLECAIIDPAQDIGPYQEAIETRGLRLVYVIDTHSHADHITGAGELAKKENAIVLMNENVEKQRKISEGKGDEMRIGDILKKNSSVKVDRKGREGDEINMGGLSMKIMYSPGHTLDSMCISAGDRIFTGDTLMIGLCGRTDLPGGSTEMMYDSIFRKLHNLKDDLLVYPAHDYKSNINSAMGYEKMNNPFFLSRKKEEFIEFVKTFFPPHKGSGMQCGVMETGATAGAAGPLMSEMCIALEKLFQEDWKKWNLITVKDLKERLDAKEKVLILDVRTPEEYLAYHIKGAINIPVKELPGRIAELPQDKSTEIVTHCESGFRSAHAALFLKAYGYTNVWNLDHGIHEWREEGYEVEK